MRPLPTTGKPIKSGSYYNPVSDGHGVDVHARGDQVALFWYTGNTNNDYPRFYFAHGPMDSELDLWTTVGGTVQDPASAVEVLVGKCRISDGLFTWVLDGVRGGIELTPVVLSTSSGIFYDPARNHEGATVQFFPNFVTGEKSCAVYFYTYGKKDILAANSETRWYAGVGSAGYMADYGSRYLLNFYNTRGRFQSGLLKTTECGKGYLIDVDVNTVILGFELDGRDETYTMIRLV
jgi:hypothetical protein